MQAVDLYSVRLFSVTVLFATCMAQETTTCSNNEITENKTLMLARDKNIPESRSQHKLLHCIVILHL